MGIDDIADVLDEFRQTASKRGADFLDDIEAQFEDDPRIRGLVSMHKKQRLYMVSVDRGYKNLPFNYSRFDLLLGILDRLSRGVGVGKPTDQVRVISWRGSRASLWKMLMYFRANPELKFGRGLIVPYPFPIIGYRIRP